MPQRQNYLTYDQQHQTLLLVVANYDSELRISQNNLSTPFNSSAHNNPTNKNTSRELSSSIQAASRQTFQSNPPYRDYQKTDKKRVYQVDRDPIKDQSEGFYTRYNNEAEDITYSNKGFEKIAVNFIRINTSCSKCRVTIFSKSKLHNHLKDGCREVTSLSLSLMVTSSIPIIVSKAMHQFFGSGFAVAKHTPSQISLSPPSIYY